MAASFNLGQTQLESRLLCSCLSYLTQKILAKYSFSSDLYVSDIKSQNYDDKCLLAHFDNRIFIRVKVRNVEVVKLFNFISVDRHLLFQVVFSRRILFLFIHLCLSYHVVFVSMV